MSIHIHNLLSTKVIWFNADKEYMKTILLILIVYVVGCAHATPHERCSDPKIASRFKNYDQCVEEQRIIDQHRWEAKQAYLNSDDSPNNGGRCRSFAPVAPFGCHMACISGSWQSVCP